MLKYNEYDIEWAEGFDEILKELGGTPPDDDEVFDFMCENKDSGWFDIPSNAYYEIVLGRIESLAQDKYRYNDFSYYVNARDTNLYVNDEPVNDWEDFKDALIEEDMGKTGMINYELFADKLGDYSELDGKKVYNNYTERYGYINDEAIREGRKTNMGGMIWVSGSRDTDTGSNWRSSDTYIVEKDDAYAKGGMTKPRLKKGDVVELNARKWQDSNGNTYHNVQVYVNDDYIGSSGEKYGYDRQYEETANKMLFDKYKPPYGYDPSNNPIYMLKDKGIRVISNGDYVNRKRDMVNFARGGKLTKKEDNTALLAGGIGGILLGIFLGR